MAMLNNQMVNDIHLGFAVCLWNFGFATFSPQLAGDRRFRMAQQPTNL
jgi:hypothetical protein